MNPKILNMIQNMTCFQVFNLAKYVFFTSTSLVHFGQEDLTVADFCRKWSDYNARSFRVKTWSGPPGQERMFNLSLTALALDWYCTALVNKNKYSIKKLEKLL